MQHRIETSADRKTRQNRMRLRQMLAGAVALLSALPAIAQRPIINDFAVLQSWTSNETYPRLVADVTGDNKADIVGFADDGVYVSVNTGSGFAPKTRWLSQFGAITGAWTTNTQFPRYLADIDGDGAARATRCERHQSISNSLVQLFPAPRTFLTIGEREVDSSNKLTTGTGFVQICATEFFDRPASCPGLQRRF